MRKKAFVLTICLCFAMTAMLRAKAGSVGSFDEASEEYGLNSSRYINSLDGFSQIYHAGSDAYTYTSTNIRSLPDASSEKKSTVEASSRVKIWGYTDNGWCYVYYTGEDGQAAVGYIRGDLLDAQTPDNITGQQQATAQTGQ